VLVDFDLLLALEGGGQEESKFHAKSTSWKCSLLHYPSPLLSRSQDLFSSPQKGCCYFFSSRPSDDPIAICTTDQFGCRGIDASYQGPHPLFNRTCTNPPPVFSPTCNCLVSPHEEARLPIVSSGVRLRQQFLHSMRNIEEGKRYRPKRTSPHYSPVHRNPSSRFFLSKRCTLFRFRSFSGLLFPALRLSRIFRRFSGPPAIFLPFGSSGCYVSAAPAPLLLFNQGRVVPLSCSPPNADRWIQSGVRAVPPKACTVPFPASLAGIIETFKHAYALSFPVFFDHPQPLHGPLEVSPLLKIPQL